jgi:CubicO group peptidase (beta-lactamase class C family)
MDDSFYAQRPPEAGRQMATGHLASGVEVPGGWRVMPEEAAAGLWSTPSDLARLLIAISRSYKGEGDALLTQAMAREMLRRQNRGPYGLGVAVSGTGRSLVLMKRGQNVGYQGYMLIFPATGQGIVVMTNSDNGTVLASAIIRRAAAVFHWPPLGELHD